MPNPIWSLYLRKQMPLWKMYLIPIPKTVIENELRKDVKTAANSIMRNKRIIDVLFDKKFFLDIKKKYGEKGVRASFNVSAQDILDELRPYTNHEKIKLIYQYLKRNKSSLQDVINNLKRQVK